MSELASLGRAGAVAAWLWAALPAAAQVPVLQCLDAAARHHGAPAALLRAVAQQESGLRADAVNLNRDGTRDLGLMQINTRWLPELASHGISAADLMDGCTNAYVGAWLLARALRESGDTWQAVGRYHSATPQHNQRYAWAIYRRLQQAAPRQAAVSGGR